MSNLGVLLLYTAKAKHTHMEVITFYNFLIIFLFTKKNCITDFSMEVVKLKKF